MNRFSLFLVALLYLPALVAQQVVDSSPIGYATVEEALTALQADATATMTSYEGWTIFNQKDEGIYILWSFTPDDHPTHPTVLRREIVKQQVVAGNRFV